LDPEELTFEFAEPPYGLLNILVRLFLKALLDICQRGFIAIDRESCIRWRSSSRDLPSH
jgi:hypothetical protein